MKNRTRESFVAVLALVLGMACAHPAPAQTFKQVKVIGKPAIVQVASGGTSAWALASTGQPYVFNGKVFALANSISLSQIAVGGGNAAQADTVWALNSSGSVFHASKSLGKWAFSQVPGSLDLIAVGPGYQDSCHPYEVWGLNTGSEIFRYNYCNSSFDQEPGSLCDIHVGYGDVWGAPCRATVYRFSFSAGVFFEVNRTVNNRFRGLPTLTVGPNSDVWAIDTNDPVIQAYRFDPITYKFNAVNFGYSEFQSGGDGIWALKGTDVYRMDPVRNVFVQVPGSLVSISVGSGGGVWGIDSSGKAFAFTTP